MSSPLLSIIVPVFNVGTFLPICIDSILSQSFDNYELILVDDGSTDGSSQICDYYANRDERIIVFHQNNAGVSIARNTGLSKATGKWVTFVDSDDWLDKDFLNGFQVNENSSADVIIQGLKYIDHNTCREKRRTSFNDDLIVAPDLEGKIEKYDVLSFGVTVCKCFRRRCIEDSNLSFDESVSYHEDHIFTLAFISSSKRIVTTSACGYNYRCGHNPQSLSKKRHTWNSQAKAARRMMDELYNIRKRFKIGTSYFNRIATFCLAPKINATRDLFFEKLSYSNTRAEMIRIFEPKKEFSLYYYPDDKRYRMVRLFVKDPTWALLYLFFRILSFRRR